MQASTWSRCAALGAGRKRVFFRFALPLGGRGWVGVSLARMEALNAIALGFLGVRTRRFRSIRRGSRARPGGAAQIAPQLRRARDRLRRAGARRRRRRRMTRRSPGRAAHRLSGARARVSSLLAACDRNRLRHSGYLPVDAPSTDGVCRALRPSSRSDNPLVPSLANVLTVAAGWPLSTHARRPWTSYHGARVRIPISTRCPELCCRSSPAGRRGADPFSNSPHAEEKGPRRAFALGRAQPVYSDVVRFMGVAAGESSRLTGYRSWRRGENAWRDRGRRLRGPRALTAGDRLGGTTLVRGLQKDAATPSCVLSVLNAPRSLWRGARGTYEDAAIAALLSGHRRSDPVVILARIGERHACPIFSRIASLPSRTALVSSKDVMRN